MKQTDLSVLGHTDILQTEAASSQHDPETQSYCSPMPILTVQHPPGPLKGQGRALPMAVLAVGWGAGEASCTASELGTG